MTIALALFYEAECKAMKKREEAKVHVAGMHMLRWMHQITRIDRIASLLYMRKFMGNKIE